MVYIFSWINKKIACEYTILSDAMLFVVVCLFVLLKNNKNNHIWSLEMVLTWLFARQGWSTVIFSYWSWWLSQHKPEIRSTSMEILVKIWDIFLFFFLFLEFFAFLLNKASLYPNN